MSEQPILPVTGGPLTCPRCVRPVVEADHLCQVPATVHRDVVRRFIEQLGFRTTDVRDLAIEPREVEVTCYVRDPATGAVATEAGGHPATRTVTIPVAG